MSGSGRLAPEPIGAQARPFSRWGFAFGSRFIVLMGVGLLALGPALFQPRFAFIVGGWDVLVIAAWLVDLLLLPTPDRLTVRRTWMAPPALSTPSQVRVTLLNRSSAHL